MAPFFSRKLLCEWLPPGELLPDGTHELPPTVFQVDAVVDIAAPLKPRSAEARLLSRESFVFKHNHRRVLQMSCRPGIEIVEASPVPCLEPLERLAQAAHFSGREAGPNAAKVLLRGQVRVCRGVIFVGARNLLLLATNDGTSMATENTPQATPQQVPAPRPASSAPRVANARQARHNLPVQRGATQPHSRQTSLLDFTREKSPDDARLDVALSNSPTPPETGAAWMTGSAAPAPPVYLRADFNGRFVATLVNGESIDTTAEEICETARDIEPLCRLLEVIVQHRENSPPELVRALRQAAPVILTLLNQRLQASTSPAVTFAAPIESPRQNVSTQSDFSYDFNDI